MSDPERSRGNTVGIPPSITDLIATVAADPTLGPRQRQARLSALKSLCKWRGKEPADAPADYRTVKHELARLNAAQCGVSKGRFDNVRSLVNRIFLVYGADLIDTRKIQLLPEWERLFTAVGKQWLRPECGRLGRWCSAKNILPSQVDQAVADRYSMDLAERTCAARPRKAYVAMCRAWNRAAEQQPALWPQVRLDPGDQRGFYRTPWEQAHAGFRTDVEGMLAGFGSRLNLVDGFKQPYAPSSVEELRSVLARLYTVAATHHRPAMAITSLAELVSVEVVRSILEFYLARFGVDNTKTAGRCAHYLYVIAKYWVRVPDDHLKILAKHRATLAQPMNGMTQKNRAMLRRFNDEARVDRLLTQGEQALAAFNKIRRPCRRDALALQYALAIELLTAAPVRVQNLASISLSRHLVRNSDGERQIVHLVFPASEVKNDIDLEFRLPSRVLDIMAVYLSRARPLLVTGSNDYLFPGQDSHHIGKKHLSKKIAATTERVLGVRVSAHQFRHLVGFLYLRENPGGHEVVRRFLGHKRIETTIDFYAGMEQAAAVEHFDHFIEARRQKIVRDRPKGAGKPSRRRPRRRNTPPIPRDPRAS